MSRVEGAVALPVRDVVGHARAWLHETWGRLTARHFLWTAVTCLAIGISQGIARWTQSAATASGLEVVAAMCLENLLIGFSLLLAIGVADHMSDRHGMKWTPYLVAALVAQAIGVSIARAVWSVHLACDCEARPYPLDVAIGFVARLNLTVFASLAYAYYRRIRKRDAVLQAAQVERERLQRHAVESRLQAMQARVEPQFLFNTLAQVERLYETDPARADRMLDDLITYLRAALPHLRETTSTLVKELDLARAYLDIVKLRLGDRFSFEVATPRSEPDARMPPMMLLPLIDHAMARALPPGRTSSFRIAASVAADRLRLAVTDTNGAFRDESDEAIGALRERLTTLYGNNATFETNNDPGSGDTRCIIELPFERSEATDR